MKTTPYFKYTKITILSLSVMFSAMSFSFYHNLNRDKDLEVVFLDVGQGDSVLIKLPKGENVLIDTGSNHLTNQKIQKELPPFNSFIDALILTHPDTDHVAGTEEMLKTNNVKNIIESTENQYNKDYYLYKKDISYLNNQNYLSFKDLDIKIYSPDKDMQGGANHKSIVNVLEYGNFSFIFMGDSDSETERKLVSQGFFDEKGDEKQINILKVGHHGSDTSSSNLFLKELKPEYCVISVGSDNRYGHPSQNALNRLIKYCKNIYRTDTDGTVSFKTDGKHLNVKVAGK